MTNRFGITPRLFLLLAFLALASPVPRAGAASLDLDQYKGKAVYLDFWASWCVPCKKSFPWMQKMQSRYGKQGLQIVAVNVDEQRSDADRFLQRFPDVNFVIVYDAKGELAEKYRLKGMPTALLFDANGKLVERHIGFRTGDEARYEEKIRAVLPERQGEASK